MESTRYVIRERIFPLYKIEVKLFLKLFFSLETILKKSDMTYVIIK